jgi:hypothetical protein
MILTIKFDYFGDEAGLKKWDEAYKKACEETDGIKYKGRYSSHQARYHWAYILKADSYDKLSEIFGKIKIVRDRKLMSHAVIEAFEGPFHE